MAEAEASSKSSFLMCKTKSQLIPGTSNLLPLLRLHTLRPQFQILSEQDYPSWHILLTVGLSLPQH
eukprot:1147499-Pelagomonas_calceolata.AAC.15